MFKNVILLILILTIAGLVACERSPSQLRKDAEAESNAGNHVAALKDIQKAISEGASQGDAEYEDELAGQYLTGEFNDIPQDYIKATEWYTKAAEQGNVDAQFHLGQLYALGRADYGSQPNYTKAIEWYTKAAVQGNAYAQFDLGEIYTEGSGVPQDYAKAAEWYTKAAQQGDSNADFILGENYKKGLGVPQDYAKAAEYFDEAIGNTGNSFPFPLGISAAEVNLGNLYHNGQGVELNFASAVTLYTDAADSGYKAILCGPMHNCVNSEDQDRIHYDLTGQRLQISKQSTDAEKDAAVILSNIYFNGEGIPNDYPIEAERFSKSAEQGSAQAQLILGLYYENGWGVSKNSVEAYKWYALAKSATSDSTENSINRDINNGASLHIDSIEKLMSSNQINQAQREASDWYETHKADQKTTAQQAGTQPETESQVATKPTTQQIITDMNQYLNQVLGPNGHIDKSLHDKFWQQFQDAPRNEFDAGMKWIIGTTWVSQEFENELWKSALLSYKSKTVVKTKRLKQLENDMPTIVKQSIPWPPDSSEYTAAISGYKSQITTSMEDANRLLNAAANHTTFVAVNGTGVELNEQVINQAAASINASFKRLSELLDEKWGGD